MAGENPTSTATSSIDPSSGFCSKTLVYHSLRPPVPLPPLSSNISIADYAFSLLAATPPSPATVALIDASTSRRILYPELIRRVRSLASSLPSRLRLSRGDRALIISPNSLHVPILYFALFSIGVVVSPINPASTKSEILHHIQLSKPVVAFATSGTALNVPPLSLGMVILDSAEFESLMTSELGELDRVEVSQSDTAAILYSSGTTGRVKGVELTHRNLITTVAGVNALRLARKSPAVTLCAVPYFHVYGFALCARGLGMGETLVHMGRFDLGAMGRAIEEFKVCQAALAPPAVVAMVKAGGSMMDGYDLSSLEVVRCGGAPLRRSVVNGFRDRFSHVHLAQAYGLTETTGRVFSTVGPLESKVLGATGRLCPNCEAKVVDPTTSAALPPLQSGELWVRGPSIMKGYVGDEEATRAILDSEGWLRTGDLCYIDCEGFLFFMDRIKEIIKYKGYQVAPAELEHVLYSHPDIAEVAIAAYPDDEAGEFPMAFVVKRPGSNIDASRIKDFVTEKVAPYKKIKRVLFLETLPKNAQGKVLRMELTKLALLTTTSKL
ncbi:hypothetical protein CDL15_Pgr024495 [Punica granatum]|uniref:4-coumarate--CoA ligase-like 9 n=1 Tax=Punica granatum TaxID=22663 RepID=A0A218XXF4_PUNGR|nr:hypothetical protein CDL15_Pgr024495 [Punica granatum]PKI78330.1 hypothetical protein CRG98_001273 [Punica granatum]